MGTIRATPFNHETLTEDVRKEWPNLPDDLSRIYPVCRYCKKVREETGEWIAIEQ